jgi:hypothetical protein
VALALCLGSGGCGPELAPSGPGGSESLSLEEFAERSRGPRDGTYDAAYIVDGDILVSDHQRLAALYFRSQTQASVSATDSGAHVATQPFELNINLTREKRWDRWSESEQRRLSYCVSQRFEKYGPTVHGDVLQAMRAATAEWGAAADVAFIHVASRDADCHPPADTERGVFFSVEPNEELNAVALAFFPSDPRAFRKLNVNWREWLAAQRAAGSHGFDRQLSGLLLHELGHVLGFRHEHLFHPGWDNEHDRDGHGIAKRGEHWVPLGGDREDAYSVMHYRDKALHPNMADYSLTACDRYCARLVYGPPPEGKNPCPGKDSRP